MPVAAQANQGFESIVVIVIVGFVAITLLVVLIIFAKYFQLWLQSFLAAAGISLVHLVAMSLRKVDPRIIVQSRIMAVQSGLAHDQNITTRELEAHYLAGGNVSRVIEALIAARSNNVELTFHEAAAIDLSGKDVLEAVNSGMRLGQTLVTDTVIYPLGSVLVDGVETRAVSLDGAIDAGIRVEIVEARDNILVVQALRDN